LTDKFKTDKLDILQAHLKAALAEAITKAFKRACKEKILQTVTLKLVTS
jgi:hypothetical protein